MGLQKQKIFVLAAEPSGDILAASLMEELGAEKYRFIGLGGGNCRRAGLRPPFDYQELHLMGFWGVLWRLPLIYARMRQLLKLAVKSLPKAVITVDSPDFSLRFAKRLRKKLPNTPFIHLVAPSVWAWRPGRALKMAPTYDHLLCLLPFEPPLFEKHSLSATFVGHPALAEPALKRPKLNKNHLKIAVLPGSRAKEVKTHFHFMGKILGDLRRRLTDEVRKNGNKQKMSAMVITAPDIEFEEGQKRRFAENFGGNVEYVSWRERHRIFRRADAAIAVSGTVSLELAVAGTPSLVIYRLSYPLEILLPRLMKVKFASLVNILADKMLIKELVGSRCRRAAAVAALTELLKFGHRQERQIALQLEKLKRPKGGVSPAGVVCRYLS